MAFGEPSAGLLLSLGDKGGFGADVLGGGGGTA